jgi:hypothetical protein
MGAAPKEDLYQRQSPGEEKNGSDKQEACSLPWRAQSCERWGTRRAGGANYSIYPLSPLPAHGERNGGARENAKPSRMVLRKEMKCK